MLNYLEYMDYFGLERSGVIHIGANNAAECKFYDAYGKFPVAFFEPIPSVIEIAKGNLARYPLQRIFEACCSDRDGDDVTFNVSNSRGMASSMFPLGRVAELHPAFNYVEELKIKTVRAETILKQHYTPDEFNLGVIDTQGADLLAIKGLGIYLDHLDALYVEISDQPLYEGGATFDQIYQYLNAKGFSVSMLHSNRVDWGNAFFKRRVPSHVRALTNAISVGKPTQMSSVNGNATAGNGNDGVVSAQRKFFCTRSELNPWWKVDLGSIVPISRIYLHDWIQQLKRADTLIVEISDDDIEYREVYDRLKLPIQLDKRGRPLNANGLTVIRLGATARWVRLRLRERNYLHMRQVTVVEAQPTKQSAGTTPSLGKKDRKKSSAKIA